MPYNSSGVAAIAGLCKRAAGCYKPGRKVDRRKVCAYQYIGLSFILPKSVQLCGCWFVCVCMVWAFPHRWRDDDEMLTLGPRLLKLLGLAWIIYHRKCMMLFSLFLPSTSFLLSTTLFYCRWVDVVVFQLAMDDTINRSQKCNIEDWKGSKNPLHFFLWYYINARAKFQLENIVQSTKSLNRLVII